MIKEQKIEEPWRKLTKRSKTSNRNDKVTKNTDLNVLAMLSAILPILFTTKSSTSFIKSPIKRKKGATSCACKIYLQNNKIL